MKVRSVILFSGVLVLVSLGSILAGQESAPQTQVPDKPKAGAGSTSGSPLGPGPSDDDSLTTCLLYTSRCV